MTTALTFPSTTSNFAFPLLFAGQAQKEFFINQALAMIDGLLQPSVKESLSAPPTAPEEGECFRVLAPATGEWADRDDQLAIRVADAWSYFTPQIGTSVFDRKADCLLHFNTSWTKASTVSLPTGGTVIDDEARTAINELVQAMKTMGIFPA